jgi:hypothetical protein
MLQRRMFRSFGSLTPGRCFLSPPGTAICFEACFSEREMRRAEKEDAMATSMTGSNENRETHDLIGSDKVEGTNVYRSNGEKVGQIERVMLDKRSGKVGYAVMSFGGFLGLGHEH